MKFIKKTCISILFIFISRINLTLINQKSISIQYPEVNINDYTVEKRYIKIDSIKWKLPIKYYVKPPIPDGNVRKAIEYVENNTCVTFKQKKSYFNNEQGLIFALNFESYSYVGAISVDRPQNIFLTKEYCNNPLLIMHELGHALGLAHEHTRSDRDDYIKINENNLYESDKKEYSKLTSSKYKPFLTGYDHSSIMHYDPYALDVDILFGSKKVIESKLNKLYLKMMGQQKKITFNDLKKLNLRYCNKCGWVDDSTGKRNLNNYNNAECLNDGYPDFNNCRKCICPTGFTGDLCGDILPSDAECNQTTFFASSNFTSLVFTGQKTCYIYLKANANYNIQLFTHYYNAPHENGKCTDDHAYEIKYLKDKGTTGLLLCGHNSITMQLKSKSNTILVIYRGTSGHSLLVFSYKEVK